jgi:hypothetical protein
VLGRESKGKRQLSVYQSDRGLREPQLYESGNLTVDEALNHPVYWESAPNKNEYGAYEAYQQKLAKKMGMTPAELQEKMGRRRRGHGPWER